MMVVATTEEEPSQRAERTWSKRFTEPRQNARVFMRKASAKEDMGGFNGFVSKDY